MAHDDILKRFIKSYIIKHQTAKQLSVRIPGGEAPVHVWGTCHVETSVPASQPCCEASVSSLLNLYSGAGKEREARKGPGSSVPQGCSAIRARISKTCVT